MTAFCLLWAVPIYPDLKNYQPTAAVILLSLGTVPEPTDLYCIARLAGKDYQPTGGPTITSLGTALQHTGLFTVDISDAIPVPQEFISLNESALVVRVREVNCSDEYSYYFLEALVSSENVYVKDSLSYAAFFPGRISPLTCGHSLADMFPWSLQWPA